MRARGGMSGGGIQQEFDSYMGILSRADAIQGRLVEFDARLDAIADKRLNDVRGDVDSAKTSLAAVGGRLQSVLTEGQTVGGGLAHAMLAKVTDRFYDLTVQSDVGLIDVSWGLKDARTQQVGKLINQQKLELKSLDDDFRSLIDEDEK